MLVLRERHSEASVHRHLALRQLPKKFRQAVPTPCTQRRRRRCGRPSGVSAKARMFKLTLCCSMIPMDRTTLFLYFAVFSRIHLPARRHRSRALLRQAAGPRERVTLVAALLLFSREAGLQGAVWLVLVEV